MARSGEVLHIIERRLFPGDVRRHFIGRVESTSDRALRVRGFLFVYDSSASAFLRKPELRTRIIALDNRIIINVLPEGVEPERVRYAHDAEGNLSLTGGSDFELDIGEFSARE